MEDMLAAEADLLGMIKEYLQFLKFEETLHSFQKECQSKGKVVSKPATSQRDLKMLVIQRDLLASFDYGDHREFFDLWTKQISPEVKYAHADAQSLEFYLYIHFTIYPLRKQFSQERGDFEDRVSLFKQFLEAQGRALCETTEFLPYYALPFVPNPTVHPLFKNLFQDSWMPKLKYELKQFLATALKPLNTPRLLTLYKEGGKSTKEAMQQLQIQLYESEQRIGNSEKLFNENQAYCHNLIGITCELVDKLDSTLRGKIVTSEYLQDVCLRLCSSPMGQITVQSADFTRPGTASTIVRASLTPQRAKDVPMLPPLNYNKLKKDLMEGGDRLKALLLQALRWRLTRSLPDEQRNTVLQAYISNDLLNGSSKNHKTVLDLLQSRNKTVRQFMAQLIITFACLADGRAYLAQIPILLKLMTKTFKKEEKNSMTKEYILTALQKLSLRRSQQTAMIESGLVGYIIDEMQQYDSLSDTSLEYTAALLLNLCQRKKGQRKCAEKAKHILKVLTDLVRHEKHEIRLYVIRALYSILAMPSVRKKANEMKIEGILYSYCKEGDPHLKEQIEFVIRQLKLPEEDEGPDSDDEEEQDDHEDDLLETGSEEEILQPQPRELSGESLLTTEYLGIMTNTAKAKKQSLPPQSEYNKPLQCPITPKLQRNSNPVKANQSSRCESRPSTHSVSRPASECVSQSSHSKSGQFSLEVDCKASCESHTTNALEEDECVKVFATRHKCPRTPDMT